MSDNQNQYPAAGVLPSAASVAVGDKSIASDKPVETNEATILRQPSAKFKGWEYALIVVPLLLIVANVMVAKELFGDISDRYVKMRDTNKFIIALKDLNSSILDTSLREYTFVQFSGREDVRQAFADSINLSETRAKVFSEFNLAAVESPLVEDWTRLVKQKIGRMKQTLVSIQGDASSRSAERVFDDSIALNNQMREKFEDIEAMEIASQAENYRKMLEDNRRSRFIILSSITLSGVLFLAMLIIFKRLYRNKEEYRVELETRASELEGKVAERTSELKLFADELNRSNRELEEFAFVASHDLQEPLRKIRAFSDRIANLYQDELGEKGQDYLRRLTRASDRMSALIEDLLEFSRVKTKGKPFEPVDMNQLIDDVLEDLEISSKECNARITRNTFPTIIADRRQIGQLLLNILSNAIKFRDPARDPVIEISYEGLMEAASQHDNEFHKICIRDNGIGIDEKYREKIFAPFQRLHARDAYKGTGIGLAICRRIVERHGGSITAEGRPGEGTVFSFTLMRTEVESETQEKLRSEVLAAL